MSTVKYTELERSILDLMDRTASAYDTLVRLEGAYNPDYSRITISRAIDEIRTAILMRAKCRAADGKTRGDYYESQD